MVTPSKMPGDWRTARSQGGRCHGGPWAVASAPGSLMLFGEHAVLRGHAALVTSLNVRIRVTTRWIRDELIRVRSDLGSCAVRVSPRGALDAQVPREFRFAVAAARIFAPGPETPGVELDIASEVPPTLGLGSSAAVTVAVMAAMSELEGARWPLARLLGEAHRVVREVQGGVGSGADVAASVFGGVLQYRMEESGAPRRIADSLPLTVVYAGYKTPTAEVIRRVNAASEREPARFEALFAEAGRLAECAAGAVATSRWDELGRLMNEAQEVMERMGVSDPVLSAMVSALRRDPGIRGAKISGSGLGDCVIGLGIAERYDGPGLRLDVASAPQGVLWEAS